MRNRTVGGDGHPCDAQPTRSLRKHKSRQADLFLLAALIAFASIGASTSTTAGCPALLPERDGQCVQSSRAEGWCLPPFSRLSGRAAQATVGSAMRYLRTRQRWYRARGMQSVDTDFLLRMWKGLSSRRVSSHDMQHFILHANNSLGQRMMKGLPAIDGPSQLPARDLADQGLYTSCAVVASSKSLLRSRHGGAIDSHEVVIRTNQAPTRGFERDVGSKTTFRVTNSANSLFSEDGRRTLCLKDPTPRWQSHAQVRQLHGRLPSSRRSCTQLTWSPQFMAYRWGTFRRGQIGESKPKWSSGFTAFAFAVNACRKVTLYGFSWGGGYYYRKRFMGVMNTASLQAAGKTASHPWLAEQRCMELLAADLPDVVLVKSAA